MTTYSEMPHGQVGAKRTVSGGRPQKYFLDERGRRLIQDYYDGSGERTEDLARWLKVPVGTIRKWSQQLGVARQRDPRWTEEEIAYLEKNLLKMSFEEIAWKLGRTVTAVRTKANRLSLYRMDVNGYTLKDLMLGLGIRDHNKVDKWIERGWIKGKKLPTSDHAAHQPWCFSPAQIREFVLAHPEEIDLRRVEKIWFIDIIAGPRGLGRLDAPNKGDYLD